VGEGVARSRREAHHALRLPYRDRIGRRVLTALASGRRLLHEYVSSHHLDRTHYALGKQTLAGRTCHLRHGTTPPAPGDLPPPEHHLHPERAL
jgi:hypothetical protein